MPGVISYPIEHGNRASAGRTLRPDEMAHIAELPLFVGLAPDLLAIALAEATLLRCQCSEMLFHQGGHPHFLHVVVDGEIGMYGIGCEGEETVVDILKRGDIFITAAALTGRPYLMSAKAVSPARVLLLPAERLRRDLQAVPELAIAIICGLATNFRTMVREVKQLKLKTAAQRLGIYILSLTPRRSGMAVVWLPHSKSLIAARIGIRPETLSRTFCTLRDLGVQVCGAKIIVEDVECLTAFCSQDEEIM